MKKYWKLMALGIFSVATVGFLYIATAVSGEDAPDYTIETRSGDAAYIEKLVLSGESSPEYAQYWAPIEISLDGTKGKKDYSLKEQLDSVTMMDPYTQKMYREHSDFLRNKTWGSGSYFEDEKEIVYADLYIENYTRFDGFEIAVLNKETNDQKEYTVALPEYDRYENLHVNEIQKINNELVLFTTNYIDGEMDHYSPITESHAYRIDLENQVVLEDTIIQPASDQITDYSTGIIYTDKATPEKFVVFESSPTVQSEEEEIMLDPETVSILAYDVATNEVKTLSVPTELKELQSYEAVEVLDSYIYYTKMEETGFNVSRFNIESDTVDHTQMIELPREVMANFTSDQSGGVVTHIDGNIGYYVSTIKNLTGQTVSIVAADLETGQVVYDGTVENSEDMNESFKENVLSIYDVYFK